MRLFSAIHEFFKSVPMCDILQEQSVDAIKSASLTQGRAVRENARGAFVEAPLPWSCGQGDYIYSVEHHRLEGDVMVRYVGEWSFRGQVIRVYGPLDYSERVTGIMDTLVGPHHECNRCK